MELATRLDRNRYHWLVPDVENSDPAAVLVEVTTPPLPVAEVLDARITTSCLGVDLGYDEALQDVIAREGNGDMHFVAEADTAEHRFLQCHLTVSPGNGVGPVTLLNDLAHQTMPNGDLVIQLGSLGSDQSRSLVLLFGAKRAAKPGRRKLATLRVAYTLAGDLSDGSTSHTVWAKIAAPGDKSGRVDRHVTSEVLFQRLQHSKAVASRALQVGDVESAKAAYRRIVRAVTRHWADIPLDRRVEFQSEAELAGRHLRDPQP